MPDGPTYPAAALAAAFLDRAGRPHVGGRGRVERPRPLPGAVVEQLTYFAHGIALACFDRSLVAEPAVAVRERVVVPSLFVAYLDGDAPAPPPVYNAGAFAEPRLPDDDVAVLVVDAVWRRCREASAEQVAGDTMGPGSPWAEMTAAPGFRDGTPIPDELTERYFAGLAAREVEQWEGG